VPVLPKHWNYFLSVEAELQACTRYVEFSHENYGCYSNEFAKLIVLAGSEVDSIFQEICKRVAPNSKSRNISDYYSTLLAHFPSLPSCEVSIARYQLHIQPWENWTDGQRPDWWTKGYNKLKHERSANFNQATLGNALKAVGAQFLALQLFHYLIHMEWVSVELGSRSILFGPRIPDSNKGGVFWTYGDPFEYINDTNDPR
jgi:hypothetical protein